MCRTRGWRGVASLAALTLLSCPTVAQAQASGGFRLGLHVAASRTHLGLHRGDATVGSVSVDGWSVSLGIRTTRHLGGEVFYSSTPKDDDPYDLAPELRMIGAMITASVGATPHDGFDLFGGVGFTHLRVRRWPDFSGCRPEVGCFLEGGPSFTNGGSMAPLAGVGVSFARSRILARLDFRVFGANDQARQATTLVGFGIGVVPF